MPFVPQGCYCGQSEWDLLVQILEQDIASFNRQQQILDAITNADLTTENVNLTGILGVAPSVGCGVSTSGTLRVAHATDCSVTVVQPTGTNLHVVVDSETPGTGATNLGKAEDSPHVSGDVGVMALGVANVAQTALAADGDYIPSAKDLAGNQIVVGNIASDSIDAGNPVKIGAVGRTTLITAVADGDRVNLMAGKYGELVTLHAIREQRNNQVTTITASTAETTIVTAVVGNFLDLYGLIVTNTSATPVNVAIRDATAGTIRMNIAVPANETRGFMLPASDGHKQATANNNWTATVSASVTSVIITALTKQMP